MRDSHTECEIFCAEQVKWDRKEKMNDKQKKKEWVIGERSTTIMLEMDNGNFFFYDLLQEDEVDWIGGLSIRIIPW